MLTLLRFAWREAIRVRFRLALITLILTIQVTALGGGFVAQESLCRTRDRWSSSLRLADLEIQIAPAATEEMPSLAELAAIPGVATVDRRFIALGRAQLPHADKTLPAIVQYVEPDTHPAVDDVHLERGRWLSHEHAEHVLVDRSFAYAHGLAIGDSIALDPDRGGPTVVIGGIGLSAEHLVPTANPEMFVPHRGSLAVIYASRQLLDRKFAEHLYNDVIVTFARNADRAATTAALVDVLHNLTIERVVPKDASFGQRFVDTMLAGTRDVSPTISFIVALMAALVTFVSVNRLVTERRREIGCFLSQGFSTLQLGVIFTAFGAFAGLLGGLLGGLGAIVFGMQIATTAAHTSGFPEPALAAPMGWLALSAASSVVVGLGAALPPMLALPEIHPLGALRGEGTIVFRGLPSFLESLIAGSVSMRYASRNVLRRAPLALATSTLIALAIGLPSGLLTSLSSWETYARHEAERLSWDAVVSLRAPMQESEVARVLSSESDVARWEGYVQGYASVTRRDGTRAEMRVRGLSSSANALAKVDLTAGKAFSSDDAAEVIWSTAFSAGHAVPAIGEHVTVDKNGARYGLLVVGHVASPTLATILVPRGTAARIFGLEGKISGAYLRYGARPTTSTLSVKVEARPTTRPAEITETIDLDDSRGRSKTVTAEPVLSDITVTIELRSEYARATLAYLSGFNAIVVPFIGLGGALAFFFVLSVLGFLLRERQTEYATLRSLGYGTSDLARIVLTEIGVIGFAGTVLSLGAWVMTTHALREPMATAWFRIALDFRPIDFASCAVPIGVLLALAAVPGIRSLVRVDLMSTLRGRGIG